MMYLFGCCARKHDDTDREGSLLSPKIDAEKQPRRPRRSKKPHYGLVRQGGQTLPVDPGAIIQEVNVAPGGYTGGNYCLSLILPENTGNVSVSGSGHAKEDGTMRYGEQSVSSSALIQDEYSNARITESDNFVAAEDEVCFSKSSDGSRWSTLCDASNGSSAREIGDGSVVSIGCTGWKVVCESPDTGISWSFPDIASSDEQGQCLDSPRVHLSAAAAREERTAGDNTGFSGGKNLLPSHNVPVYTADDVSEYTAISCAQTKRTERVPEFLSDKSVAQEDDEFLGNEDRPRFSNDVVRVTQYVLETMNRVCGSFVNQLEDNGKGCEYADYGQEIAAANDEDIDDINDNEVSNLTHTKCDTGSPSGESNDFIYTEDPGNGPKHLKNYVNIHAGETKDFEYAKENHIEASISFTSSAERHTENYNSFYPNTETNGKGFRVFGYDGCERMKLEYTDSKDIHFDKNFECIDEQQTDENNDSKYIVENIDDDYENLVYTNDRQIIREVNSDQNYIDDKRAADIPGLIYDLSKYYTANLQQDEHLELIAYRFVREVMKSSLEQEDLRRSEPLPNIGTEKSAKFGMALCNDEERQAVSEDIFSEQNLLTTNEDMSWEQVPGVVRAEIHPEHFYSSLDASKTELPINIEELLISQETFSATKEVVGVPEECINEMQNLQQEHQATSDDIDSERKTIIIEAQKEQEQLHIVSEEIHHDEHVTYEETRPTEEHLIVSEEIPFREELSVVSLAVANDAGSFVRASIMELSDNNPKASNYCRDIAEDDPKDPAEDGQNLAADPVAAFEEGLSEGDSVVSPQREDHFDLAKGAYNDEGEDQQQFSKNLLLQLADYCEEIQVTTKDPSPVESFHEYESCNHMEDRLEPTDRGLQNISQSSRPDEVKHEYDFSSYSAETNAIDSQFFVRRRLNADELTEAIHLGECTLPLPGCTEASGSPNQLAEKALEEGVGNKVLRSSELLRGDNETLKSDLVHPLDELNLSAAGPYNPVELYDPIIQLEVLTDDGYSSFPAIDNTASISTASQLDFSVIDFDTVITCQSKPDMTTDEINNRNGNNNQDTQLTDLLTEKTSEAASNSKPVDNKSTAEVVEDVMVEDVANANMLNLSDLVAATSPTVEGKIVTKIATGSESSLRRQDSVDDSSNVAMTVDTTATKNSPDSEGIVGAKDDVKGRTETPAAGSKPERRRNGKDRFIRTKVKEEDISAMPMNSRSSEIDSEAQKILASTAAVASPSSNPSADFFSMYIIDLSKQLIEEDNLKTDVDGTREQRSFKCSNTAYTVTSPFARNPDSSSDQKSAQTRLMDNTLLLSPDSCRDLANFVGMEDDAQRPPIVRRSISLKTSPTGTPRKKKAVRFADALGLDLESIRHIRSNDDNPTVSTSALPNDSPSLVQSPAGSEVPSRYLYMEFSQPGSLPDFLCRVYDQKVSLESCLPEDRDLVVTGCVRVYNISFRKEVVVRYTTNGWVTSRDIPASYITNSSDGTTDRFSFAIILPRYFDVGCRLEFAIWFRAGDDLSVSHWDNNHGANYSVDCYSNCIGGNRDCSTWLQFL